MRNRIKKIKNYIIFAIAALFAVISYIQPAIAQQPVADVLSEGYLANIQSYLGSGTTNILAIVQTIPTYLVQITQLAMSMLATDNSSNDPVNWSTQWSNEQNWIATLSQNTLSNEVNQYNLQKSGLQQTLLTTFFGSSNLQANTPNPANVNDLSYITLLGQLLVSPDPRNGVNPAMNYLTNASGLNISLTIPGTGWRGTRTAQQKYTSLYNTVTSVQTYNAFVLSRLYQDSQTVATDYPLRQQLISQSSNSSWFSSVISNDLGWVLRQILLYNSQLYVLMDQLLQTQKQMLAATAMTNSLFIANSQFQADMYLQKAQGT